MQKKKIAYVCNFSNEEHRSKLHLRDWTFRNRIWQLFNKSAITYKDYAPWNGEFFKSFEKDSSFQFYVIYPHTGVLGRYQKYTINGVVYYAINSDISLFRRVLRWFSKNNNDLAFISTQAIYSSLIKSIKPDLLVICGLEIPECISAYQDGVPIYAMLQTLLNRDKSIQYSIGTEYTRTLEIETIKKLKYIGCPLEDYFNSAIKINPNAYYFKIAFPAIAPPLFDNIKKEFSFVFFAGSVMKNKGVEDAIKAYAIVRKKYPETTLNIIGKCATEYRRQLDVLIQENNLKENVFFSDYFSRFEDVYKQVQKSSYVVLPSITAPFNTTVRESMFMGMPTIVYSTSVTKVINQRTSCLLEARMEDIEDLASKMIFAIENQDVMLAIGRAGKAYAENHLSSESLGLNLIRTFSSIIGKEYYNLPIDENLLYKTV
jgi:glycosyltransferase involved in cell wall biosynthesis